METLKQRGRIFTAILDDNFCTTWMPVDKVSDGPDNAFDGDP